MHLSPLAITTIVGYSTIVIAFWVGCVYAIHRFEKAAERVESRLPARFDSVDRRRNAARPDLDTR